mmetsp:Transcript_38809/g.51138  ORF Transcript_38809/g.51138 Transcript_38809/m.51138 type:complete len:84 (+) Transcript_38809:195-446(+)
MLLSVAVMLGIISMWVLKVQSAADGLFWPLPLNALLNSKNVSQSDFFFLQNSKVYPQQQEEKVLDQSEKKTQCRWFPKPRKEL